MNEPIYQGLLQSDLDFATRKPLNANLADYAGDNLNWNPVTNQFDAEAGGTSTNLLPASATVTELLNSVPGTRTPIASLATGLGNYFDSQSFDPCVIVNPLNANQLIMFFTGMAFPVSAGNQTIGRATANISDPTTWTVSASPVLTPTLGWESGQLRADTVLLNPADNKFYLFYSSGGGSVGCASSSDLGLTWTKLGQVLTPTAPETWVSQFAVLLDGSTLHALYAYRTASLILPAYRYASASTSDWLTWTKGGVDIYSESARYVEFHHLFKVGSAYVLCYESGSPVAPYDIRFATSSNPASGWVRSPSTPFLAKSEIVGTFDRYHTATPHVRVINGYWYLIYCGALDHDQPYDSNHWQMGIVPLTVPLQTSPLYIGTDLRLVAITGGGKLQARNPGTGTWADVDQWTNP